MSHFSKLKTILKDKSCLLKALADVGYTAQKVEIHDQAQNLYGYQGDMREQTAEIIVRRKFVGGSSNDLGFKLQSDGTYEAIISDYDRTKHNQDWLNKLSQRYAYHKVKADCAAYGYVIEEELSEANGQIQLTVSSGAF